MNSKCPLRIFLAILVMLGVGPGCTANFTSTPLPTLDAATATVAIQPTNTPAPTTAITSTPDEVATLHAIETASIQTLISTVQPEVLDEYPSPDGKWRVEVIRYDCIHYTNKDYKAIIAYEQLKLISLSDGTETFVDEQPQACDGIGMAGFGGLYWSLNNRYFYYTDSREGYPETCGNYAMPAIYRLDTRAAETMMVGGGLVSPDQTKLAMWERNEIVIWDLDQGEVARVQSLERVRFNGEISWSPDGKSVVYLQTEWDCAPDYGKTYLTRLDLADMSQELLLEHEAPGFGRVSWETMNRLTLWDGDNEEWRYNFATKELLAIP